MRHLPEYAIIDPLSYKNNIYNNNEKCNLSKIKVNGYTDFRLLANFRLGFNCSLRPMCERLIRVRVADEEVENYGAD